MFLAYPITIRDIWDFKKPKELLGQLVYGKLQKKLPVTDSWTPFPPSLSAPSLAPGKHSLQFLQHFLENDRNPDQLSASWFGCFELLKASVMIHWTLFTLTQFVKILVSRTMVLVRIKVITVYSDETGIMSKTLSKFKHCASLFTMVTISLQGKIR